MKDFVLGSEEFLIRSQEHIEEFFLSRGREKMRGEGPDEVHEDDLQLSMDDRYLFDDPLSGQTTMHAFSDLINDLSKMHNEIAKDRMGRVSKTLRDTSAALFRLQQRMKGEACRLR
jgi:hypothetical protein